MNITLENCSIYFQEENCSMFSYNFDTKNCCLLSLPFSNDILKYDENSCVGKDSNLNEHVNSIC